MRHSILSLVLAAGLSVVACSEQPTETRQDSFAPQQPSSITAAACPSPSDINAQITALFPAGSLRQSALSQFKSIPAKTNKPTGTAARDKVFAFIGFVLKNYFANMLLVTSNPDTKTRVLTLITSVDCYSGVPPQTFPPGALGPDGAAAVITPTSLLTTVKTGTGNAGVQVPTGAVSQPVVVTITRLPDGPPGPLLTSLNQFPRFYQYSSSPEVTFNLDVIAGVCLQTDPVNLSDLRLGHNFGPNFGDVEVLPFDPAGFLICTPDVGSANSREGNYFAWAKTFFLPAELHATTTMLVTTAVGGTTKKYSPFGAVDPGSNPGSLSIVNQSGSPISGVVSGPGTVYVKAASKNGDPIKSVPVKFGGASPVLTGPDGIASFDWSAAAPGASLVATVDGNEIDGESCPIPAHGALDPYRPRVCFTPSSVTFSEPLQLPGFGSTGIHYRIGDVAGFESTGFTEDGAWATDGIAPFGTKLSTQCFASEQTEWPINNILLARKSFTLGAVPANGVDVRVVIDNDVQLFVNGHDVTPSSFVTHFPPANYVGFVGGYQKHGNCPTYGADGSNFLFHVLVSDLVAGTNLLAIRANDLGGVSFLDFEVTVAP